MPFTMPEELALPAIRTTEGLVIKLIGPTGVGKSFSAKKIHEHYWPDRKFKAFSFQELGDANTLKSALFGIVPHFINGVRASNGLLADVEGGTLFLDEVQDVPLEVQAKLVVALEERTVLPLGATQRKPIDIPVIIIGSQISLDELVRSSRLRGDLYYRLDNGPTVYLRPLREYDRQTFEALVEKFGEGAKLDSVAIDGLAKALWQETEQYSERAWPGNIRELKNAVNKRQWLPEEGVCDEVRSHWLKSPPPPGRSATPTQQWMGGPHGRDDVKLLKWMIEEALTPDKSGPGRKRLAVKHARRLAECLLSRHPQGISLDELATHLGCNHGQGFERLVDDLTALGFAEVIERDVEIHEHHIGERGESEYHRHETKRFLRAIWPQAQVVVVVVRGEGEIGWQPQMTAKAGDVVEVRVQLAFTGEIRVGLVSHSEEGIPTDNFDGPIGLLEATPRSRGRYTQSIKLDAHVGWEQIFVHVRPQRKPVEARGGTFGVPSYERDRTDARAMAKSRERAREEWGPGWMTDFVIRTVGCE